MASFFKFRSINLCGLIILSIVFFFSCSSENVSNNKDILHVRMKKDPGKLNPILKASPISRLVFQYIMPQMCDYNSFSLEFQPVLLTTLPVVTQIDTGKYSGMSNVRMTIKPNAKWDDGSQITAKDYVFTIKIAKHPLVKNYSWRVALTPIIDIIENANDSKVFDVIVQSDYYLSVEWISTVQLFPQYIYDPMNHMDRISITALNDTSTVDKMVESDSLLVQFSKSFNGKKFYKDKVVGFGPYQLEEWETDQYIRLVKKTDYWAKTDTCQYLKQGPNEIIFHIIPDEINAISQLKSGQLDVLTDITPTSYEQLLNNEKIVEKYNFFTPQTMKHYFIGLNNKSKYLQDIYVRKALAHATNVSALIESVEYNRGERIVGNFSPKKEIYNNQLDHIPYDIKKSKELLLKAGWKDSDGDGIADRTINGIKEDLKIDYLASLNAKSRQIAALIKQQASAAGFKIEIASKEFRIILNKHLKTHDFDMTMLGVTQSVPPDDPYMRWHSDNIGFGKTNFFQFSNSEADKLIERIRITKQKDVQKPMYFRFQEIMQEQQVIIPLYEVVELILINKEYEAKCFTKRPNYLLNTFKYKHSD